MKNHSLYFFVFIYSIIAITSCKQNLNEKKAKWSESQKRKYFSENIAYRYSSGMVNSRKPLWNFRIFIDSLYPEINSKNKYNSLVYAFEEPYIDTTKIDSSKSWIRVILSPCWRIPTCLTLEKRNCKSYLTSKITNGKGGYYSGNLLATLTKVYSDTLFDNISKELQNINFWNLGVEENNCDDGETWDFEAIEKGKYNYITRFCLRKNETNLTRVKLYKIGLKLLKLGNFFDENYIESWPFENDYTFLKSVVDTSEFNVKMIEY
jgi:hypothetical protein